MHSSSSTETSGVSSSASKPERARRYGIIIPACNEEACLELVICELRNGLPTEGFEIAVGVNGSIDRTAECARSLGVLVAETSERGYGFGCQAAIEELDRSAGPVEAYIFMAADGANHPADIARLVEAHHEGYDVVLGSRTTNPANWIVMGSHHVIANLFLGAFAGALTGRYFRDLGPLRLIRRETFKAMRLQELTFGWTIEAQIRAAQLGVAMCEVPVRERHRVAGNQKVSRVSWRHSLRIGLEICRAGWRTHRCLADCPAVPVPLCEQ